MQIVPSVWVKGLHLPSSTRRRRPLMCMQGPGSTHRIALLCITVHCTASYCITLHHFTLHHVTRCCTASHCTPWHCTAPHGITLHPTALQHTQQECSALTACLCGFKAEKGHL